MTAVPIPCPDREEPRMTRMTLAEALAKANLPCPHRIYAACGDCLAAALVAPGGWVEGLAEDEAVVARVAYRWATDLGANDEHDHRSVLAADCEQDVPDALRALAATLREDS